MLKVQEGSWFAKLLLTIPEVGDKVFCITNDRPYGKFELEATPSLTIAEINGLPSVRNSCWKVLLFGNKLDGGIYTFQVYIARHATEKGDVWILHPENNEGNECFN